MQPRVADALLAAGVTAVLASIIALSQVPAGASPNLLAFVFAVGFGAVLLVRRRLPLAVLVVSVLGTFAYYTLDLPPIGVALPVVAALSSAAEVGRLRWAIGAGAVVFAVSLFFRIRDDQPQLGYLLGYDAVSNIALIAAGIALGHILWTRRVTAAQQAEIARLSEAQLTREAQARVQHERERISRELHDTLGHTMSVISLQAGVGSEAVGRDDDAATEALGRIRDASTQSLRELRSMVRILRTDADPDQSRLIASLSALPELVTAAEDAGVRVSTNITADPAELSAPVDAAAYRVIQESLTNVVRHAQASRAEVSAVVRDGRLHIRVTDNGRGGDLDAGSGYGLVGMEERVRLLGGTLTTRSYAGAGVEVEADIPARLP